MTNATMIERSEETATVITAGIVAGLPRQLATFFLLLFVAASTLYGAAWRNVMVQTGDTGGYYESAADLADFSLDQLHDRTPGYPLLLLLTGAQAYPTQRLFFVSLLLHLIVVWLLVATLHRLGLSDRWLKLFGILLLLPPSVQTAATVMTENLAQFFLAIGFASLVQWLVKRRIQCLLVTSGAFACAGLTRPTYQALAVAVAVSTLALGWYLHHPPLRETVRNGLLLIAASVLILGGFSAFNAARFGYFGLSPMAGLHLATRTVRFWERLPDEDRVARDVLVHARDIEMLEPGSSHTGYQAIYEARPELVRATGKGELETLRYLARIQVGLILRAPLNYLSEVGRALGGSYWFPVSNRLANMNSSAVQLSWAVLHFAVVGVFFITVLLIVGALVERLHSGTLLKLPPQTVLQLQAYVLAGTIVFYTMILSCAVDIGDPRQRQPTDCLIMLMSFLGPILWRRIVAGVAEGDFTARANRI